VRPYSIESIKRLTEITKDWDTGVKTVTGDPWLDARYEEDIPIIGHLNPYYRTAFLIARTYRPRFTVELGIWRATWSAHVAAANPQGTVIGIDIHREDKVAQQKARDVEARYSNFHYVNAWTWDAGPVVKSWGKPIEMLYIDAWHHYEHAMREWELYSPMLADGALVICDDLFDSEGTTVDMRRFWAEISEGHDSFVDTTGHCGIPMGYFKYVRGK